MASTPFPSSSAAESSLFRFRPVIATRAPSAWKIRAVAKPMPLLPPVISAVLPASLMSVSLCFPVDYGYNPISPHWMHGSSTSYMIFVLPSEGPMCHSKSAKAKTHKRIVAIASKRFREEGIAGVGIAELMKEAGLTVGGFYKHFNSRDDLVAEALGSALGGWKRQVDAAASGGPP